MKRSISPVIAIFIAFILVSAFTNTDTQAPYTFYVSKSFAASWGSTIESPDNLYNNMVELVLEEPTQTPTITNPEHLAAAAEDILEVKT